MSEMDAARQLLHELQQEIGRGESELERLNKNQREKIAELEGRTKMAEEHAITLLQEKASLTKEVGQLRRLLKEVEDSYKETHDRIAGSHDLAHGDLKALKEFVIANIDRLGPLAVHSYPGFPKSEDIRDSLDRTITAVINQLGEFRGTIEKMKELHPKQLKELEDLHAKHAQEKDDFWQKELNEEQAQHAETKKQLKLMTEEVEAVLKAVEKRAIRVREGGGLEELRASLAVTVLGMDRKLKILEDKCASCSTLADQLVKVEKQRDDLKKNLDELNKKWTEEDQPLNNDEELWIHEAFPTRSGRHELYADAMRMVGAKRSKFGLVGLVNWLLVRYDDLKKAGSKKYAEGRLEGHADVVAELNKIIDPDRIQKWNRDGAMRVVETMIRTIYNAKGFFTSPVVKGHYRNDPLTMEAIKDIEGTAELLGPHEARKWSQK